MYFMVKANECVGGIGRPGQSDTQTTSVVFNWFVIDLVENQNTLWYLFSWTVQNSIFFAFCRSGFLLKSGVQGFP